MASSVTVTPHPTPTKPEAAIASVQRGATILNSHAPTTAVPFGQTYSLHDCLETWQAGLHNLVWPINMTDTDGRSLKHGLVVVQADGRTPVTITFSVG